MNCKEINIWIKESDWMDSHANLPHEIEAHIQQCDDCRRSVEAIQASFGFMKEQSQASLSDAKTDAIINLLAAETKSIQLTNTNRMLIMQKVAAILIVAVGLLTGILAGGILGSDDSQPDNPWKEEFTLLSDNQYSFFD